MRRLGIALLAVALLPVAAGAGESGYAVKQVELKTDPSSGAQTVAPIAKDAKFEILKSERGWVQVSVGKAQGWLRMFYVALGQPSDKVAVGKEVGSAVGLAAGRQGRGEVTAVVGIRGLSEEQLKAAKFNAERLKAAESFRVSAQGASAFAAEAGLAAKSVDPLPAAVEAAPSGGRNLPSGS